MPPRSRIALFAVALIIALGWGLEAQAKKKNKEDPAAELPSVEQLLEKLDRLAGLYRDNALRFTCNETIFFTNRGRPSIHKFRYIYRYSEEDEILVDYRVLRGRKGELSEEKQERIALENYGLQEYMLRAYSWVFLFSKELQPYQQFAIEGAGEWRGHPSILLRFEPVEPYRDDPDLWYGTAWIDRESYQLLHVEAIEAEEYDQYRMLQRNLAAEQDGSKPNYRGTFEYSVCSTDFDVVKHGMRFPGRNVIQRSKHHVMGGAGKGSASEERVYQVTQTYAKYQFFSVRTEEQIRSVIEGDR